MPLRRTGTLQATQKAHGSAAVYMMACINASLHSRWPSSFAQREPSSPPPGTPHALLAFGHDIFTLAASVLACCESSSCCRKAAAAACSATTSCLCFCTDTTQDISRPVRHQSYRVHCLQDSPVVASSKAWLLSCHTCFLQHLGCCACCRPRYKHCQKLQYEQQQQSISEQQRLGKEPSIP